MLDMAMIIISKRLPKSIVQARRLTSYQSSFLGLRAAAVFNETSGFGFNSKEELVIVKTSNGTSTDGYNYGLLFQKQLDSTKLPVIPTKLVNDRDIWIEKSPSVPPNRGNEPWQWPLLPRCGAATFSTFAAGRHNSKTSCTRSVSASFSSLAGDGYGSNSNDFPLSLVIFDKDGTLINMNSAWIPWMESHVKELERMTGLKLAEELYCAVGYCPKDKEFRDDSLLACATIADLKETFENVLVENGFDKHEAKELVDGCCSDADTGTLEPLGDLTRIFGTLKSNGVKTAVCTMDSRLGTMTTLHKLGIVPMIDMIVCGDDKTSKPKPAPDNAINICKKLDVCPTETVVIGDTTADTGMGKSAGLGLTIGVLSGAGSKDALEKESDLILNSVDELIDVMFKNDSDEST